MINNKAAGTAITDANGDAVLHTKQYAGDPQAWVQALGGGYTAEYKGSKNYKPSKAYGGAGVSV
ncbi:hypothetical protein JK361_39625 [Streptomyces sp. 5-8]|uniref:Uncharacterized protein n=2 Tax=Streptomyces TaxID=1883 RepID=A0ABS1PDX4_9ACTN|nr:hypothetical protein [Streptomyces musisoli]MBL1110585.1 hypothetical protein [Streptomyces musisoli]